MESKYYDVLRPRIDGVLNLECNENIRNDFTDYLVILGENDVLAWYVQHLYERSTLPKSRIVTEQSKILGVPESVIQYAMYQRRSRKLSDIKARQEYEFIRSVITHTFMSDEELFNDLACHCWRVLKRIVVVHLYANVSKVTDISYISVNCNVSFAQMYRIIQYYNDEKKKRSSK